LPLPARVETQVGAPHQVAPLVVLLELVELALLVELEALAVPLVVEAPAVVVLAVVAPLVLVAPLALAVPVAVPLVVPELLALAVPLVLLVWPVAPLVLEALALVELVVAGPPQNPPLHGRLSGQAAPPTTQLTVPGATLGSGQAAVASSHGSHENLGSTHYQTSTAEVSPAAPTAAATIQPARQNPALVEESELAVVGLPVLALFTAEV
jgi:hypothetical protein